LTTEQAGGRKFASYKTYSEIIQRLGYVHCPGGYEEEHNMGGLLSHSTGFITDNTIHWKERRPTKRGLRLLLLLVARVKSLPQPGDEEWLQLYFSNMEAKRLAKQFHVRFPRSWAAYDRARAWRSMLHHPPGPMSREFPEQRKLLRRIDRWARP